MASERLPNRWGIAVAAVIMQICLGAVYGWSVFKIPLMRTQHWTETQVRRARLAVLLERTSMLPASRESQTYRTGCTSHST